MSTTSVYFNASVKDHTVLECGPYGEVGRTGFALATPSTSTISVAYAHTERSAFLVSGWLPQGKLTPTTSDMPKSLGLWSFSRRSPIYA